MNETSLKQWSGPGKPPWPLDDAPEQKGALGLDAVDAQRGVRLPVPARAPVVLALLVLENADFVIAPLFHHGGADTRVAEERRAQLGPVFPAHEEHFAEGHLLAERRIEQLDVDGLALRHPILLAA